MNKPLTDDLVSIVAHQPRPDAGRQRTPAEMGEQLVRNAKSLELTGAHLVKDQAFYEAVAVDLREASVFLMEWQGQIERLHSEAGRTRLQAAITMRGHCAGIARGVRDLVPDLAVGGAASWRSAANAIRQAILASEADDGGQAYGGGKL
jgi:hypothetical protein